MAELCNLLTCRLCLQKQFQLLPMFPANEPVNDELLRKIYECAAVRISYEYDQSSVICIKCIVDVEQFYTFKQRCVENDLLFRKTRLDFSEKGADEGEFETVGLPEGDFMEPITNLEDDTTKSLDCFTGPSTLVRVGYNYRIVRVNDETDVLVYLKHRFYQPTKSAEWNRWVCVANGSNSCPARLIISSKEGFPLALFTKPIQHNHPDAIVQAIGSMEPTQEQIVQILPQCTLVLDCNQRLQLLAEGYRYRCQQSIHGAGNSLWCCVRSDCTACIELSYEDSRTYTSDDHAHCHEVEEDNFPSGSSPNTELMAQKQPKHTRGNNGLNYYISDGTLVYSGNYYKAHRKTKANKKDDATKSVWKCMVTNCSAKVQINLKSVEIISSNHNHTKQITKNTNSVPKHTIQQGFNYCLIAQEHGYVRLQYRKQRYTFQNLLSNGTSEWSCIWKHLGCTAMLRMLSDEQLVYGSESTMKHDHRIGNKVEQYFPITVAAQSSETNLWNTSTYKLLWNRNSKPIIDRHNDRYYARTAFTNGTIRWHCVRGIGTYCDATITIDKSGEIIAEHSVHEHEKSRKNGLKVRSFEQNHTTRDIFTSPGPVRLLAGGFNYRRMHDEQLNIDIVVHVAHKYLSDGAETKGYHCVLRDEPQACPGRIVLTNNALCAEILAAHNHLARSVPKTVEPERSAQVIVEGPNYELMYSMTGRNCLLLHEGHVFRVYKLLEPSQTSRWRCIHAEVGCKAFLSVPLSLTKPATMDAQPHDHSRVKHDTGVVKIKQEIVEDSDEIVKMKTDVSPRLRPRVMPQRDAVVTEDVKRSLALLNPTTSDANALSVLQDLRGTLIKEEMKREMLQIKPDPDAMTCFLNGHLYVRQFEDLESLDSPEWMCAFRWTLSCSARLSDLSVHTHERFASVRTNDRFNMLKTLISHGLIGQRGVITQMPERQKVSEYELLPSNGNLSLIIDENRYYFYKAKNNGEWLWRCVRYRWQGCKIGVAVSHCFGKYYYQPYGKTEHVHSS